MNLTNGLYTRSENHTKNTRKKTDNLMVCTRLYSLKVELDSTPLIFYYSLFIPMYKGNLTDQ